ncbi:hypothetical protein HPB48_011294 [Haemaphysalis longicornis]|uniref:Uncharacterized protein n=1 Tax=Haemaphysalis longicornis TaxID=44386 RepID=A0A9J6FA80_HAELO|nr:hypothetical protein HPB48_011294 [Haemaphysalis longicornis]
MLAGMSSLKVLELDGCLQLTGYSLQFLACGVASLEILGLSFCHNIRNPSFKKSRKGPGLGGVTKLNISSNSIYDDGLRCILLAMPKLRSLELRSCPNLTTQGFLYISAHGDILNEIDVSMSPRLTNSGCQFLLSVPNLKKLSVHRCRHITSRSTRGINATTSPGISELNIGATEIGEKGIRRLSEVSVTTKERVRCSLVLTTPIHDMTVC